MEVKNCYEVYQPMSKINEWLIDDLKHEEMISYDGDFYYKICAYCGAILSYKDYVK